MKEEYGKIVVFFFYVDDLFFWMRFLLTKKYKKSMINSAFLREIRRENRGFKCNQYTTTI